MSSTSFIRSSGTVSFDVNPAPTSFALWSGRSARLSVNHSNPSRCKRRRRVSGPGNAGSAPPSGRPHACARSFPDGEPCQSARGVCSGLSSNLTLLSLYCTLCDLGHTNASSSRVLSLREQREGFPFGAIMASGDWRAPLAIGALAGR